MSILKLFPGPFVYVTGVKNHQSIKENLISLILSDSKSKSKEKNVGDGIMGTRVKTSYFEQHTNFSKYFFESGIVNDVVWNPLDECIKSLPFTSNFKPIKSKITDLWYNRFEEGGYHGIHNHAGSCFSGIYFLQLNEINPTKFVGFGSGSSEFQAYEHGTEYVKEGDVLFFLSDMLHYVQDIKNDRITISFNIESYF